MLWLFLTFDALAGNLQGVTSVSLLIEELSSGAVPCGVYSRDISDAFKFPVSGSRLVIAPQSDSDALTYYVNVQTVHQSDRCISYIRMDVYTNQYVSVRPGSPKVLATIVLWGVGALLGGPSSTHGKQVKDEVEDLTKGFVTQWNLDNKP
jgi:hypothetical protein